jgi:hypothetical protein
MKLEFGQNVHERFASQESMKSMTKPSAYLIIAGLV